MTFVPTEIKRGDQKGSFFLTANFISAKDAVAYLGEETALDILSAKARQLCQAYTAEATDDDGTFHEEDFVKMAEAWSARGESIKVLQQKIVELAEQIPSLDVSTPAGLAQVVAIGKRIKSLKEDMAAKRRKSQEDLEAEQAAQSA